MADKQVEAPAAGVRYLNKSKDRGVKVAEVEEMERDLRVTPTGTITRGARIDQDLTTKCL